MRWFQCRTRLCWWCKPVVRSPSRSSRSFQCRTRLCWWCKIKLRTADLYLFRFQCRTRLCWWCKITSLSPRKGLSMFQCRTRLCWWCKSVSRDIYYICWSFNAARGFVGGARGDEAAFIRRGLVSMPHAALLVVQDAIIQRGEDKQAFQCRTRLCWWCKFITRSGRMNVSGFQCRTRLCWWCKRVHPSGLLSLAGFQCRTRLCWWCKL